MDASELTTRLKAQAQRLGFSLAGVCPAAPASGYERFAQWLAAGYAGQMSYLADRAEAYAHPQHVLKGVRSIMMLAMPYDAAAPTPPGAGQGRVSRYAWGNGDYHDVIHDRLKQLIAAAGELAPSACSRGVVDTAPLLEREYAQLAGLGWIGKNTLLLSKEQGSYFFLAALLTDLELSYDEPFAADHCGTCRACLDACPTGAFVQPYVLDATRCISYLTIELRDPIPIELREPLGDWLFGCDVCQDVCPWNHHAAHSSSLSLWERSGVRADAHPAPDATRAVGAVEDLIRLFALDDDAFRQRFRHTPLWRPKRRGILRNAAIVLGNRRAPAAVTALIRGLNDAEPLVRGACAWALGRYEDDCAIAALRERLAVELDETVRSEIGRWV
jgi:epoxyqueuosine reductase